MSATITPKPGKRYVTRGGWVTPPLENSEDWLYPFCVREAEADGGMSGVWTINGFASRLGKETGLDLISEYVEPSVPTANDTFRRDLIARLYVAGYGGLFVNATGQGRKIDCLVLANTCIRAADALIEAMEVKP